MNINEETYEKARQNLGKSEGSQRKNEESYEENKESYVHKCMKFWGKPWENEKNLRKHEESYETEQIYLSGNATFPITFLFFG